MRVLLKPTALRTAAARQGLSMREVGELSGIDPSSLSRALANSHELRPRKRRALLLALNAEFDEFFEIVTTTEQSRFATGVA